MNRKYLFIFLSIVVLFILFSTDVEAQCSMCRKVAEGKGVKGANIAKNLNYAILYLMAIPYLALAFIFRKQIKGLIRARRAK